MRFPPSDEDTCYSADIIDLSIVNNIKEILPQNHDNSIEPILDHLPAIHEDCNNPALFAANSVNEKIPTPKLKELPSHLEYDFLDNNRELPVIISSLLSNQEKRLLFKQDAKPRLIRWVLLLQKFTIDIKDKRGTENLAADHLSRLENLSFEELTKYTIQIIYCHPFITAKKLEEIRNFKQERDETLYYAWKRYNDLLYQCPLHNLNCQQKVHIFYTGLDISTRKILDSSGFIPLMTPTQALESIQVMADHSHNWYDETTTMEKINDVLDNVDTIHESFKGEHLTKEHPLKKEDEAIKHSRYMESLEETIIKFCVTQLKNRPRIMKG
ncbi:reverse transcriptase domain-containing protein [Tanacetum coccineum]